MTRVSMISGIHAIIESNESVGLSTEGPRGMLKVIEGLPASSSAWQMRKLGHETIVAVSPEHGAYLIADGKAQKITPLPGPIELVMVQQRMMFAIDVALRDLGFEKAQP